MISKNGSIFVCAIAALAFISSTSILGVDDPSTLSLIQFSDLTHVGTFRVPAGVVGGGTFSFGGSPIAYNPSANSLFIGARSGRIAEVGIVGGARASTAEALPFAPLLQGFTDPTEGNIGAVGSEGVGLSGLIVSGDRIYGTASIYYDANNAQRVSHFSRSIRLNDRSFSGWTQVWETARTGFVSGFMSVIPAEWQGRLGGNALTGQCCLPVVHRTSLGPSAFAFSLSHIGASSATASPLLYYTLDHPTLGPWEGTNASYGLATGMGGVVVVAGTRTVLYFGRNGVGPACYGTGTGDRSLEGASVGDGSKYCFDPTDSSKGTHAFPYRYQIWAYDLNDLAAVRAGAKQPWDVVPYGVWPFELPIPEAGVRIGGVGYDPQRQLIYISQMGADRDTYEYRPVIHALQVNAPRADITAPVTAVPPPIAPVAPPLATVPPPIAKVTSVTLTADKTAPQPTGTSIGFRATAVGGAAPLSYKWQIYDGANWLELSASTSSPTVSWTPTKANADYRVAVMVNGYGDTADQPGVSAVMPYAIGAPTPVSSTPTPTTPTPNVPTVPTTPTVPPVPTAPTIPTTPPIEAAKPLTVTLSSMVAAPQPVGTRIVWTAAASGGVAPYEFKFSVFDGSTEVTSGTWATANTFAWTPTTASMRYFVFVWARSKGNTGDPEAAHAKLFMIVP